MRNETNKRTRKKRIQSKKITYEQYLDSILKTGNQKETIFTLSIKPKTFNPQNRKKYEPF